MAQSANRRNASVSGSSRLSLSVGKSNSASQNPGRHPLKHDWSLSYVHRPPTVKGIDYEKEIKRVATFGSIESFLHLYSHLTPVSELEIVTDVLVFLSRIGRPGIWEEMRDGGKFTLRLVHPVTPILFETLLFGLIGDQFDESDNVVGCVLSKRGPEDILSVWVEEEGESVKSGQLREKIISMLNLPQGTVCEYRANKALLDAAAKPQVENQESTPARGYHHHTSNYNHHNNHNRDNRDRGGERGGERGGDRGGDREHQGERQHAAPRAYHRRDEEGGERKEPREPRANGWNR